MYLRKKMVKFTLSLTPIQLIVTYYIAVTLITVILLSLPFFHQSNTHVSFLDTLFMSISTVSVTGLTTFPIHEVYNHAGIILLEILFQIGGFGITMISTMMLMLARRKIGLHQRQLIMIDMNQPQLSGSVALIRSVFYLLISTQLIFGFFFGAYLFFTNQALTMSQAFFDGFYLSISSVTNAGFDVTGQSMLPYAKDYFLLLVVMVLIFMGGIGFPVLTELKIWLTQHLHQVKKSRLIRFTIFTKLAISSAVVLLIVGAVMIFLAEFNHYLADKSWIDKFMISLFYSVNTRNAGSQINPLSDFSDTTLLIFALLMFIGASPSSVGGGVRTTTITILGLYLWSFIRGHKNVTIFNRRIGNQDIQKSIVVVTLSILLCVVSVLILSATEDESLVALILEVASAFGTTGLSLGITAELSWLGKWIIMALMFVGRIGMLYTLMFFLSKRAGVDEKFQYPTENIIIG